MEITAPVLVYLSLIQISAADSLSPRERQVAELVAQGCTHKEVGGRLGLAEGTITFYVGHVFKKLDVSNQAELIRYWILNVEMKSQGCCRECCLKMVTPGRRSIPLPGVDSVSG